MLITFRSNAAGPIMMFGEVGTALLKMMGQSGVVPGAITGADVPRALAQLKAAVAAEKAKPAPDGAAKEEDDLGDSSSGRIARPVGIATRAVPLLDLLERAAKANADVLWEGG
jgi:Domain of unknown function (DUF1840)